MKALVKAKPEVGIWMQDVPEPSVGPNEVKIKIKKTSICGTDVHIYNWDEWSQKNVPVPLVTGHEYSGVVHEIGAGVTNVQVGDRVSGEGHIITNPHSRNYYNGKLHLVPNPLGVGVNRMGAFAEYLVIPSMNVFKLPDYVSDDVAAIFDPFGNAVHTALSFDMVCEDVLITGAGPIGIMAAAVCRHAGARNVVITDVNPYRLDLVKKLDDSITTVNVKDTDLNEIMTSLDIIEGFDVGLEMSGNVQAFEQMIDAMIMGGRIAMLGIFPAAQAFPMNEVILKGLFLKGIYGREMFETWYKMSKLVQTGLDLNPLITHRFPIDDYEKGFDIMRSGESGKVILDWTSSS